MVGQIELPGNYNYMQIFQLHDK